MAQTWWFKHEYDKSLADLNEAIRLDPKLAVAFYSRAWLWATCPDARYRDGEKAVESATRACDLSTWKDARQIAALAAAYAELGDFQKAVEYGKRALALEADAMVHMELERCLTLFKDKKPYRDRGASVVETKVEIVYEFTYPCPGEFLVGDTAVRFPVADPLDGQRRRPVPSAVSAGLLPSAVSAGLWPSSPFAESNGLYANQTPDYPAALHAYTTTLGIIADEKGQRLTDIRFDFNEATGLEPKDAWAFLIRGKDWWSNYEYDKALADYNEAIRLDSKCAEAFLARGQAWSFKDEYDKALADYNEAIRLNPEFAGAFLRRGHAWCIKNEYDKALADYNEAIRLNPKGAWSFVNRGNLWFIKRDYDKALADYDEAIRLNARFDAAFSMRGVVWMCKKRYDKALADYDECIRLYPTDAVVFVHRGQAWRLLHEYDKALADYDEAIRLNPVFDDAFNGRAWLWATCPDAKHRDGRKAVESATHACEAERVEEPRHNRRARCRLRRGGRLRKGRAVRGEIARARGRSERQEAARGPPRALQAQKALPRETGAMSLLAGPKIVRIATAFLVVCHCAT